MNSIDVSVDFSYQGKHYKPEITIDLDRFIKQDSDHSFYPLIARENDIDTYSYLYEVMQQSALYYRNPKGLAVDFMQNGHLNLDEYGKKWEEDQILNQLLKIAINQMGIRDFNHHQRLKKSLLQAYRLGASSRK